MLVRTIACVVLMVSLLFFATYSQLHAANNCDSKASKSPHKTPYTNVMDFGAAGDGKTDDTQAIRCAIDKTHRGGTVLFPVGNYRISETIKVTAASNVSLVGMGLGSQIFQSTDGQHVFDLDQLSAVTVKSLYLGSIATQPRSSLIKMTRVHRSTFENIIMYGGYYGFHIKGSLSNTFIGIKSGINIGVFFDPDVSLYNNTWIYSESHQYLDPDGRPHSISSNANTFVGLALSGGTNGMTILDGKGQGNFFIHGGTIEGAANIGLLVRGSSHPSVASGVHFENNKGIADIVLDPASRVNIQSSFIANSIQIKGLSTDNVISSSQASKIEIGEKARRTRVVSTVVPAFANIQNNAPDTHFVYVSSVNDQPHFGTIGIGVQNPTSDPGGSTPNLKLDVEGKIRAAGVEPDGLTNLGYEIVHKTENVELGANGKVLLTKVCSVGKSVVSGGHLIANAPEQIRVSSSLPSKNGEAWNVHFRNVSDDPIVSAPLTVFAICMNSE